MLGASSLPPSGATTSESEKQLRASFCGAANHLTQMYMLSMKQEKQAYQKGYCAGLDAILRHLLTSQTPVITIQALTELIGAKKREYLSSIPADSAVTQTIAEEEEEVANQLHRNSQQHQQPMQLHSFHAPPTQQSQPPTPQIQPQIPTFGGGFGPNSAPFQGGHPPTASPTFLFSSTTTSNHTLAASTPSTPTHSTNTPRKRPFYEIMFDSAAAQAGQPTPFNTQLPNHHHALATPSTHHSSHTNTSTSHASSVSASIGSDGDMDFSTYPLAPTSWKRSRIELAPIAASAGQG